MGIRLEKDPHIQCEEWPFLHVMPYLPYRRRWLPYLQKISANTHLSVIQVSWVAFIYNLDYSLVFAYRSHNPKST